MEQATNVFAEKMSFASSLQAECWSGQTGPKGYQYWYFDALSDDGREAIALAFFDNFVYSPRYNSRENLARTPAIVFCYYRDGKPIYRIAGDFPLCDFAAEPAGPGVKIAANSCRFDSAPYGKGYLIEIRTNFQANKQIEARFEWLLIESDFLPNTTTAPATLHWNLVAPRADVTGHLNITDQRGKILDAIHFRGTGYHDRKSDTRYLPATIESWQWGRAHFADATAVFCRYKEIGDDNILTRFYVVRHGELRRRDAVCEEAQYARDIFGLKYPSRLRFESDDNMKLRVKQGKVIDSSFFYLRFLSEMTLTLRDGKPRKTIGITDHLYPRRLNYRWLDWLIDLRIGKNGKSSFLT
jgi:carotenoid 1,2-hydratase